MIASAPVGEAGLRRMPGGGPLCHSCFLLARE
jgi:hypothetical protein